jgi:hypothetical protein
MKSPDRSGRDGDRRIGRDRARGGQQGRRRLAASPAGSPPAQGPPGAGPGRGARTGPRTGGRLHAGPAPSPQATAREHAISLSRCEQSRLRRIQASLCRSDPKLAGMLGVFGRLCAGQRMPAWEQAPSRLDRIRQAAALLAAARALAAIAHGGRARPRHPRPGGSAATGRPAASPLTLNAGGGLDGSSPCAQIAA